MNAQNDQFIFTASEFKWFLDFDVPLSVLLDKLTKVICRKLQAHRGLIVWYNRETRDIELIAGHSIDNYIIENITEFSRHILENLGMRDNLYINNEILSDDQFSAFSSVQQFNITAVACLPIILYDRISGFLYLDFLRHEGYFDTAKVTLLKDFSEIIPSLIQHILEYHRMTDELRWLKGNDLIQYGSKEFICKSRQMVELIQKADRAAQYNTPILITGENGTGKTMLAEAIHNAGIRSEKNFVVVDCSTIPDTLFESEVFGYAKGAFTGATSDKKGRIEIAHEGTLFLEEIGDLPLMTQGKLLRLLESKKYMRVGDIQENDIDVRIIAATNKNLKKEIEEGRFRQDLYYRLAGVQLQLPPLRKREEDILLLVNYFLQHSENNIEQRPIEIHSEVQQIFVDYRWPGNVRELKTAIDTTLIFLDKDNEVITKNDLPVELFPGKQIDSHLKQLHLNLREKKECEVISETLRQTKGNKSLTAKKLGMSRGTLYKKLTKYKITKDKYLPPESHS